jgi:spermidine synthase
MPDPYQSGALILEVDGTPQSHVFAESPDDLFFEYIRRIGHVIDLFRMPGQPITAVHLGGGALTLPRYIVATRPGSRQQVLERHADLIDFVREHLPLPSGASIRFRYGDARETLNKLPAGLRGTVDLVVVDIFAGARTPAHVTSQEFFIEVSRLLSPDGVVVVNVADGPGLTFARAETATLAIHKHRPRIHAGQCGALVQPGLQRWRQAEAGLDHTPLRPLAQQAQTAAAARSAPQQGIEGIQED